MIIFPTVVLLLQLQESLTRPGCRTATETEHTSWGQMNVTEKYRKPFHSLHGMVVIGVEGPPMEGVLVELYDHPEIAEEGTPYRKGQQRLAACVTGKDGRFSFDPKPGKYELRFSKPIEWNCTSVLVTVSETADKTRRLTVKMNIAN